MGMRSINTRPQRITPRGDGDSLNRYLQDVTQCSGDVLTPEEEVELFMKIKQWDNKAREKFIKANLRFVISVAKQYTWPWAQLQDLISEWNIWLIKAVDRFDETRWFKFISYAVWRIRQSMLQYISTNTTIRRPLNKVAIDNKISKYVGKFLQEYQRFPTVDEISDDMEIERKEVLRYFDASSLISLKSLDDTWYTEDSPLVDIVPDSKMKSPDFDLEQSTTSKAILDILNSKLTEKQRTIITMYFWIWQDREKSLEEIAEILDISRERVRQVRDKALKMLKKAMTLEKMNNSLNE